MKKLTVLCIGLILLISLSCTSSSIDDLRLSESVFEDPKGFFSVTPPDGWSIKDYPDDARGKVAFFGPRNVELRVLTNSVDFTSLDGIIYHAEAMEKKLGIKTNITKTTFNGRPAVERTFLYKGDKFRYVDFLVGRISHNIAYSAPKRLYEDYQGIAMLSFATYQPLIKELSKKEADENYLAKMRRVGKLYIEMGSYNLATEYIEQGLAASPTDPELLNLKSKISENRK